jgi:hypothetical protein
MARRDRGALATRALFGAGLLLLGVVAAVLLLRSPAPKRAPATTAAAPPPATTTAPATTAPATTAPAPPPSPVQVAALTPFSATISWRTDTETTGRVALSLGSGQPTLWSAPVGPSLDHSATIRGLAFDTDYRVSAAGHEVAFHTPLPSSSTVATTGGGAILLDGNPFFPLMVWGQCPAQYGNLVAAGINLIAQNPCGGTNAQVEALAGRALSAGIAGDAEAQNPSLIGWFFPDEADLHRLTGRTLPPVPESSTVGRISFLTLSNHVYSRADPLAWGRAMYPGLIARADVIGFDLYPLQNWCLKTQIDDVYTSQLELVDLARGKPTFQWIESAQMDCGARGGVVTPKVIRAESWLAVAGGAHGLGFFPGEWTPANAAAVASVGADLKAIAPALLAPSSPASANAPLRVTAHVLEDAVYVVVVNPSRVPVRARVAVGALGDRTVQVLGGGALRAHGGVLSETLAPLAARIYVAPPA